MRQVFLSVRFLISLIRSSSRHQCSRAVTSSIFYLAFILFKESCMLPTLTHISAPCFGRYQSICRFQCESELSRSPPNIVSFRGFTPRVSFCHRMVEKIMDR